MVSFSILVTRTRNLTRRRSRWVLPLALYFVLIELYDKLVLVICSLGKIPQAVCCIRHAERVEHSEPTCIKISTRHGATVIIFLYVGSFFKLLDIL